MPCAACSLQMGKFTRSSSQSSSKAGLQQAPGKSLQHLHTWGVRHASQVGLTNGARHSPDQLLSPMLMQVKARQSAGSHLVVACCSWLPLLIPSAPGRAGDQLPSRISTPPHSGDQPCGELSGKAAQALLTNLSHQSPQPVATCSKN